MIVGVVHPGSMGAAVAGAALSSVRWASEARSEATAERARVHRLEDSGSLGQLVVDADVIVSICPPAAACEVAGAVAEAGFDGIFVDANAISPATAMEIAERFDRFVDAGIIGPPPIERGSTRLYLAGDDASVVAELWSGSLLEPVVMDGQVGSASALKVAYAGYTKGSAALLITMAAYATSVGVAEELFAEWDMSMPGVKDRLVRTTAGVGPKAWRFVGEMDEIARSLELVDLPPDFHEAAAEIYSRLADLRGTVSPTLADVMESLGLD